MPQVADILLSKLGASCALAIAFIYLIITTVISYRRLSHIPGPRFAAFSKLWFIWLTARGDQYKTTTKLLHKYGEFVIPR
jgi:ATP/ADP translocase